jgi:hypothetical protein
MQELVLCIIIANLDLPTSMCCCCCCCVNSLNGVLSCVCCRIKLFIPPDITSKHHVLFTFMHVAVDVKKRRKGAAAATVVAQVRMVF